MIHEILGIGKENLRTTDEILEELQILPRKFYEELRNERREGFVILSQKDERGGYWLWDGQNVKELENYYNMQRGGAVDVLATLEPIRRLLKEAEKREYERNETA